ncbi:MAG: phosphopantothenoylcysteine decarboxylase [Planctomycetaceae bacterium]|nr:MAG: phosphopantothenoylcysteine decarboxylase [Planctomycetaceae bacterium]
MTTDQEHLKEIWAGRELIVGVSGGIAAYKAAELTSRLVQTGAQVSVVLTAAAKRFVQPTTFAALTARPVYDDLFAAAEFPEGVHIGLARRASAVIVAPATADLLAKASLGLADDLLTTLLLATRGPFIAAPAMNSEMWQKPAVQRHITQLQHDGWHIVPPDSGWLSCRQTGPGRMADLPEILNALRNALA